ncbi:MAG TPA: hypothetical protein VEQ84_11250 [Vicinamibacteria bacterium]|nr:hypothetical protein [Gemmatimonadales bacterium]HYU42716.1 hypothetical protein [Vicinamibacteria bacterium]
MRTRPTPARITQLSRVCREFEHWRRTRPRRSPIPAALWALAVEHARAVGVHATARRLRLDYYALKQRVGAAVAGAPGASAPPAFIEVVPAGPTPAGVAECVIDLADARGATMRIVLKNPPLPDLAALSQGLWRSRA